jgi:hypothetical protein
MRESEEVKESEGVKERERGERELLVVVSRFGLLLPPGEANLSREA